MKYRTRRVQYWFASGSLIIMLLNLGGSVLAQHGPGMGIFSYQCQEARIQFYEAGTLVMEVPLSAIAGPLAAAQATGTNMPIRSGQTVSLWALKSNELQIHQNDSPDTTNLVLPSAVCGEISTAPINPVSSGALAFVQIIGPGSGIALALVGPDGETITFAGVSGHGQALAAAFSSANGLSPQYHIVQPGENLFRIAMRYHTTVAALAALNGLNNPRLIFVGQKIYLP
jgi:hypothetical protein